MKHFLLLLLVAGPLLSAAQKVDWKKIRAADPDLILQQPQRRPVKVLLLGTFHFGYPNLDSHKTDSANFVDVLSPQRQRELKELAEVIARFRPTRFYVESQRQAFHDSLYAQYRAGRYRADRNEIYQIGYRVAAAQNLPKLYTIDASNLASDREQVPMIDSMWSVRTPVDSLRDQYWNRRYKALYDTGDSLENKLTMLENFLLMAEPKTLFRMHGHYLSGGFATAGNEGPDALATWWYDRNLRIFNNILKTAPAGGEDRIVLLIGNGHVPLLKQCFQSSPEFEVVELKSLLR